MNKIERLTNNKYSGLLLNLLLPGAGHVYFREYVFGMFVFVIWVVAAILFYLSFVIDLNHWAKLLLFGLPMVFYFFTFFDLHRSLKKKRVLNARSYVFSIVTYGAAIIYQLLAPVAPVNFALTNGPIFFVLDNHKLSPLYSQGSLMKASRLTYRVEVTGFDLTIVHHFPQRYDLVRFNSERGNKTNAVVLGLPQEEIEIVNGRLIINGTPDLEGRNGVMTFSGNWPSTILGAHEFLVATLNLGNFDQVYRVSMRSIIGKIETAF